jgi:GNAT superfamily N-acetyltransferase
VIALRAARSTDAGNVGAILTQFAATTPWMPRLHSAAQDIAHAGMMIDRGWVTVAHVDAEIVGFSACNGEDLDALYVFAEARGLGVGTALLKHLQAERQQLGLWTFQANTDAQRFYLRHGFQERRRTDGSGTEEKLPDIRYLWQREARP